jgi:aspartyl protease family protein
VKVSDIKIITVLLLFCTVTVPVAASALDVEVKALFTGAALLSIDGREQLLKTGQVSEEGVSLISADADQAIVEIKGQRLTLHISNHIASAFEAPSEVSVSISMNPNRQYITHGSINGRPVQFLVDTGANFIAMNASMATKLGISLADGVQTQASTASDVVTMTMVTVGEVQVGEIRRNNVRAMVSHSEFPTQILLGMSFLQHVDIRENAGLMVLTTRF